MLLQLPVFNALLAPCPVSAAAFTAHEQGLYCGHCQRVVQDFSRSENPVADLAAARAAAPDGRVCGSFRREQVVAPPAPMLSRRLRWFLMALVLVVGQGLTAREALAQVRRAVLAHLRSAAMPVKSEAIAVPEEKDLATPAPMAEPAFLGFMVGTMPTFRGGGSRAIVAYIQKQVVWPQHNGKMVNAQGRLFASFTVGADGKVHDAKIVKTFNPLFNEPVLKVLREMRGFTPGMENGKPTAISMTVPVSFSLK
ncbi:energy transducer TonB [Hymenobacter daeguensis]